MKKVLVLGGTGLLGNHTIHELLARGYEVTSVALPPLPAEGMIPDEVESVLADVDELSDEAIEELLADVDGVMYAIGADERIVPPEPALSFFYEANVRTTQRWARLAAKAGVQSFVIFGSYFSEWAERLPDSGLKDQPYPNTRLLQEQVAFAEGKGRMAVSSLRLPYIFGTVPGQVPLWKMFTDAIKDQPVFPAPQGGTTYITAEQVAQAALGALERKAHRATYAVATAYLRYSDFYALMVQALNQHEMTEIPVLDYEALKESYLQLDEAAAEQGLQYGIKNELSGWVSSLDLPIEPRETMSLLGIQWQDTHASIIETLDKCVRADD